MKSEKGIRLRVLIATVPDGTPGEEEHESSQAAYMNQAQDSLIIYEGLRGSVLVLHPAVFPTGQKHRQE